MKKILVVIGTRPEAIKMCPLVLRLREIRQVQTLLCVTGQHRELLDEVLAQFSLVPDYDLDVRRSGGSLVDLMAALMLGLEKLLQKEQPELAVVHGDTTSAYAAATACFHLGIPVAHVEAGLRSGDLMAPFPEEFNRRSIDMLSRWHFAPTEAAREKLLAEGCDSERIYVTGNTGLDALAYTVRDTFAHPILDWVGDRPLILATAHRRENRGEPMEGIFSALNQLAAERPELCLLFAAHPYVYEQAAGSLQGENVRVTAALPVDLFHNLLARCRFVLTDSGGIQEEAAALGRPALVMRERTERTEALALGSLRLTGTKAEDILKACRQLLDEPEIYEAMCRAGNPFGDGRASGRIAEILARV